MNIEEIRKNAPKGATHYSETPMEYIFLRLKAGGWQCYVYGDWYAYELEHDEEIKPIY